MDLGPRYLMSAGYDREEIDGSLGIIHIFTFDAEDIFIALRTSAGIDSPVVDSITPIVPGAGWSEREVADLLGVDFTGHPDPRRLVLSDDWPEGVYPHRKSVPWNIMPPSAEDADRIFEKSPPGMTTVPVGPFHPALHEPAHFSVYLEGETIRGCDYRGFMTHRGIEKLCQSRMSYTEVPFVAERICGICGSVHAASFSQCVELAAGIKITRRAEYIRTIFLELERLHSHLLWVGVAGHLIGYDTVFMHSWRVREHVMWLAEKLTGNRKTYGMICIGGVRRDITPEHQNDILDVLNKIEKEILILKKSIIGDTLIHRRTKGVGYLSREDAVLWSLVGPTARARGVDIDSRRDHPCAAYDDMNFEVPVADTCDVWGTVIVRILELFESISIIRQAVKNMPGGGLMVHAETDVPAGIHAVTSVEAPRGEAVHYLITGNENRPERWRVRAPTFPNLQGVPSMLKDEQYADLPVIIGSIDPCFSCTDRVSVVDIRSGNVNVLNKAEFENLSRKK